jgi:hypothetical protein
MPNKKLREDAKELPGKKKKRKTPVGGVKKPPGGY